MGKFRRGINGNISELSGNRRRPFRLRKTVGYNEKGYQIYETIGYYATYVEAQEALFEFNKNPYDLSKTDLTVKEVMELMLKELEKNLKPLSYNNLRSHSKKLDPISHMKFKDVDTQVIQKIVDEQKSVTLQKNVKTVCTHLYKFAKKKNIFVKDYAEFLEIDKENPEDKKEKVPYTIEEIKECFEIKTLTSEMLLVLLFTGMRSGELIELKKENIHLEEGYLKGGSKSPAGINRIIPISRYIKPILEKWMNTDKPHLFYNQKNNKMKYLNFQRSAKILFPNHLLHECRHTFVSNMDRMGCNLIIIKRIVGHKSTDVTEKVYTHKTIEELVRSMKEFDDYMEQVLCF